MVKPFKTQSQGNAERAEALRRTEPRLVRFAQLARSTIRTREVWLFGSRARGDSHPASDWDLLVVLTTTRRIRSRTRIRRTNWAAPQAWPLMS